PNRLRRPARKQVRATHLCVRGNRSDRQAGRFALPWQLGFQCASLSAGVLQFYIGRWLRALSEIPWPASDTLSKALVHSHTECLRQSAGGCRSLRAASLPLFLRILRSVEVFRRSYEVPIGTGRRNRVGTALRSCAG